MGCLVRVLPIVALLIRSLVGPRSRIDMRASTVQLRNRRGGAWSSSAFRCFPGVVPVSAEVLCSLRVPKATGLRQVLSNRVFLYFFSGQSRRDRCSPDLLGRQRPVFSTECADPMCSDAASRKPRQSEAPASSSHLHFALGLAMRLHGRRDYIAGSGPRRAALFDAAAQNGQGFSGFVHPSAMLRLRTWAGDARQRESPFRRSHLRKCVSTHPSFFADENNLLTEDFVRRGAVTAVRCGQLAETSGLLAVDKPKGMTSLDVCKHISRLVGSSADCRDVSDAEGSSLETRGSSHRLEAPESLGRRNRRKNRSRTGVGHAGTLDPSAAGRPGLPGVPYRHLQAGGTWFEAT